MAALAGADRLIKRPRASTERMHAAPRNRPPSLMLRDARTDPPVAAINHIGGLMRGRQTSTDHHSSASGLRGPVDSVGPQLDPDERRDERRHEGAHGSGDAAWRRRQARTGRSKGSRPKQHALDLLHTTYRRLVSGATTALPPSVAASRSITSAASWAPFRRNNRASRS